MKTDNIFDLFDYDTEDIPEETVAKTEGIDYKRIRDITLKKI